MRGIIIGEPWVSLILSGSKTWEMRTTRTQVRGRIAIFRKGSRSIVGLADVVDFFGSLDDIAWGAHRSKHQIPEHMDSARTRWNQAWILASVVALETPVSYDHPAGAVIWVNLDRDTEQRCLTAAHMPLGDVDSVTTIPKARVEPRALAAPVSLPLGTAAPVANDGTFFGPHVARSSGFTLGAKGEELVIKNLDDALVLLRAMPVPRWRRPNAAGNLGIVTGKAWQHLNELTLDAD